MHVARTIDEIRRRVAEARAGGCRIGLVPTMGALHEAHFSLVRAALAGSDFVVVSIFVNPTQFGPGEDYQQYPRATEADLAACERAGTHAAFLPPVEAMYPTDAQTQVSVGSLAQTLCGRDRPTHFAGVCTVVAKLFNIVLPDRAWFGEKDFQQAVILRQMAADLDFPVEILTCPIVREADGLAMSSRNAYLSTAERKQAVALSESLALAEGMIRDLRPPADAVVAAVRGHLAAEAPDGEIDYVQIVDPQSLCDVQSTDGRVLVALAVRFGSTRLIDNVLVDARNEST